MVSIVLGFKNCVVLSSWLPFLFPSPDLSVVWVYFASQHDRVAHK